VPQIVYHNPSSAVNDKGMAKQKADIFSEIQKAHLIREGHKMVAVVLGLGHIGNYYLHFIWPVALALWLR